MGTAIINIGLQSTELSVVGESKFDWAMPLGAQNFTDQFLVSDPPKAEELSAGLSVVELHVDDLRREFPGEQDALTGSNLIAIGEVLNIAVVERGEPGFDVNNYCLPAASAEEVFRAIAVESSTDRMYNPGMQAGFVDHIVGSCCILVELIRQLGWEEMQVSNQTSVNGVLTDLGLVEFVQ